MSYSVIIKIFTDYRSIFNFLIIFLPKIEKKFN
jgi:hypothetical protein